MKSIEPFIIKKDQEGNEYAIDNPKYLKVAGKKKYELLLKESEIPPFYWNIEFTDYKGEISVDSLKKSIYFSQHMFNEKFKHIHLYLFGVNNSQKTAVAINIGKEAIKQGKTVKFVLASSLIDKLMKVQGFSVHEEIEDYLRKLKYCDLIIIDDVFDIQKSIMWKNPESNAIILSAWDTFLREILVSEVKVVMTSNIEIEMIKEKFGNHIYNLIDRNFICLQFLDNIKMYRKKKFENLFT